MIYTVWTDIPRRSDKRYRINSVFTNRIKHTHTHTACGRRSAEWHDHDEIQVVRKSLHGFSVQGRRAHTTRSHCRLYYDDSVCCYCVTFGFFCTPRTRPIKARPRVFVVFPRRRFARATGLGISTNWSPCPLHRLLGPAVRRVVVESSPFSYVVLGGRCVPPDRQ